MHGNLSVTLCLWNQRHCAPTVAAGGFNYSAWFSGGQFTDLLKGDLPLLAIRKT
jgi:hypothetical protein